MICFEFVPLRTAAHLAECTMHKVMRSCVIALATAAVVAAAAACASDDARLPATDSAAVVADTGPRMLAVGTLVEASVQQPVSSRTNKVGDVVKGVVRLNVVNASGRVVIPGGADVTFSIARLAPASSAQRADGVVALDARSLVVGGRTYELHSAVNPVTSTGNAGAKPPADRDAVLAPGTPITIRLTQQLLISTK